MTKSRVAPEVVGRYRVLREIGRGSMGRVYEAHDPNIERKVALKVLSPAPGLPPEAEVAFRERFIKEARAAGRLNHRGIVTIHDSDVDQEQDLAFIAMELVEGESLAGMLEVRGRLDPAAACVIVADIAEALHFAHDRGVVHRDIKPANILIARSGQAKLADFGIAKLVESQATLTGQVLGSPSYMSPEQIRAEPLDGRSDLFSLGVVLYESLTGERPFSGKTIASIAHKICEAEPAEPRVEIPDALSGVLTVALAKEREKRYATGNQLAEALRSSRISAESAGAEPVSTPTPAAGKESGSARVLPRLLRWIGLAAIALILVAVGWGVLSGKAPVSGDAAESRSGVSVPFGSPLLARRSATLVVLHENRLKSALMTIRIDDREVWAGQIGARGGILSRARGDLVRVTLPVEPGRHVIDVTIKGAKGKVDAAAVSTRNFESDETRHLRVKLLPLVDRMDLDWES